MGMRVGTCVCPCCGARLAPICIHEHTLLCEAWKASRGGPWPKFKYSYMRAMYLPSLVEGVDFVRCYICYANGWDFRFRRMVQHLGIHGIKEAEYFSLFPGKPIRLEDTTSRREATVLAKYGVSNVFQDDAVKRKSKETMVERYGVTSAMQSEVFMGKAAQTNLERYGAENPFGSKVIQEKIRETNTAKYGVPNPRQSAEVRDRIMQTTMAKYGVPHFFQHPDFSEVRAATCSVRYGAPHHMQSGEGRAKLERVLMDKYGVPNPFMLSEIQQKAYNTNLANHGGVHHLSLPEHIEARKKNILAKYGVDNISKVPAIKEKIVSKLKAIFQSGAVPRKTSPEVKVDALTSDCVVYSGDWSYWVTWKGGRRKNPDFVVLTPEQVRLYQSGTPLQELRTNRVIEVNGDFWHTSYRGCTREEREKEFTEGYASIGLRCLILWESDLNTWSPEETQARIAEFIGFLQASRFKQIRQRRRSQVSGVWFSQAASYFQDFAAPALLGQVHKLVALNIHGVTDDKPVMGVVPLDPHLLVVVCHPEVADPRGRPPEVIDFPGLLRCPPQNDDRQDQVDGDHGEPVQYVFECTHKGTRTPSQDT